MRLYAGYLKEREGMSLLENEFAFLTFIKQADGSYYVRDLYVDPDHRREKHGTELTNAVMDMAIRENSKFLYGSVSFNDPNFDRCVASLTAYGMRKHGVSPDGQLLIYRIDVPRG